MDGLAVREQYHAEMPLLLRNVYPPAHSAISLNDLREELLNRERDPFVSDSDSIGALPSVAEVLCGLEDTRSPKVGITWACAVDALIMRPRSGRHQ